MFEGSFKVHGIISEAELEEIQTIVNMVKEITQFSCLHSSTASESFCLCICELFGACDCIFGGEKKGISVPACGCCSIV